MRTHSNTISELAAEIRETFQPDGAEEVPYLGLEHVEPGTLQIRAVGKSSDVSSSKKRFKKGDILFGTMRPYFRKVVRPDFDGVCSTEFAVIRPNREEDGEYVFYYLAQPRLIEFASTNSKGDRPRTKWKLFSKFPATIPQPPARTKIGLILCAYDDLIGNNLRRMALLGESARQLYREWFVRLRFPGHEHTPITNGVPEGWLSYALDDLCRIGRGASPRPINKFMAGEIPWFKIGDATASESPFVFHTQEHVTEDGAKKSVYLEPGSLVLSNSATCGIPYFTGVHGCVHDGWLHFADFNRITDYFLYCYLYFKRNELVSSVGDGSTQKNLNTSAVGRLRVVLPAHDSLLQQFSDVVTPIFAAINVLARQNISLRAARDLLLPRLMSDEIKA